jgi:hypothetical protein
MTDWQPIETAPRDRTPVRLKCEQHPEFGEHVMWWQSRHNCWAGYAFAPIRKVLVQWDPEQPQPTHWRAD